MIPLIDCLTLEEQRPDGQRHQKWAWHIWQNKVDKEIGDQIIPSGSGESKTHETIKNQEKIIGSIGQSDSPVNTGTRGNDNFIYSLIEAKFDAKNECNLYKLKCEQLEEEKLRLEKELFDANSEIDSFEESDNDGPLSFLSGLPENIIAGISKAAFENEHTIALNVIRSTKLQVCTSPRLTQNPCYAYLFVIASI